jgi:hypothetical protein
MKQCLCFSGRRILQKGERSRFFDYAGSAREKLNPVFIDLTKPEQSRPLSRNRIEVCRDREKEPYTAGKFLVVWFGSTGLTFHVFNSFKQVKNNF